MKKSEFRKHMHRALTLSGESLADDLDGFAALAERAGARWDPEEPEVPGGEWTMTGSTMVFAGNTPIISISEGTFKEPYRARQRACLARLVAIREAARKVRTPLLMQPNVGPCCVNLADLHALFALLGKPVIRWPKESV